MNIKIFFSSLYKQEDFMNIVYGTIIVIWGIISFIITKNIENCKYEFLDQLQYYDIDSPGRFSTVFLIVPLIITFIGIVFHVVYKGLKIIYTSIAKAYEESIKKIN